MIDRRSQLLWFGFLVSDLALSALAWVTAYLLRFETGWIAPGPDVPPFSLCARQLPLILILAGVAYRFVGMYDIGRLRRFREEMSRVLRGTALLSLFVMSSLFFLHDPYESRATILLFSGLTLCQRRWRRGGSAGGRSARLRSRGYNQAFALIVGSGRGARAARRRPAAASTGSASRTSASSTTSPSAAVRRPRRASASSPTCRS